MVLAHHGVKGMKWGERKAPTHGASPDHVTAQGHIKKAGESGLAALSNKELQDVINRRNLEKQYTEGQANRSPYSRGHKLIKGVLNGLKTVNDTVNTINQTKKSIGSVSQMGGQLLRQLE